MINLIARLGLDTSGFATGMARADLLAKRTGANISSSLKGAFIGAFGTAAVTAAVKDVVEFGGKISDLSKRTFLSKQALQEFNYIAEQTGTSLDAFVTAEQKLAKAQQEAIDSTGEMRTRFERFGLTVQDLKRLDPHQLFMLLSSAIGNTDLSTQQLTDVLELFGRGAGDLIPAMKEGFDGMVERAKQLGIVLQDDVIDKLDEIGDRMNDIKLRGRKVAAGAAMTGVETAEELGAVGSGFSAVWQGFKRDALGMIFNSDTFGNAVDEYNEQIINAVGARSLIPRTSRKSAPDPVWKRGSQYMSTWDDYLSVMKKNKGSGVGSFSPEVFDPLNRIGGFGMGADPALRNDAKRQVDLLAKIEQNTRGNKDDSDFPS